ncbi:sugar transferase [Dokdonia pacifica]|uniref:Exopolysaccharide biosynthesis polyprenyl glycosylphosphotransferase n=1 Tax=Dokdonia pacifica TaxID=1627892 RepID=A0A239BT83_9FLAO|nr:sugar transferase [Dokdonia pacifica]GGG27837.1 sugar transferase [Dokdonia pacifica]SNS10651.1 exopolysaccharide biosynthesis polyprenyl glycosylphosphotransferase [Dokdonia pacifica]
MALLPDIHFEISERKILLRILDTLFVLACLQLVGNFFDFDYFKISQENWLWIILLTGYLNIFGTVFELYNLQQASKFQTILKNTILTVSVTALFYLLTPFYTPELPENRLQIIYFFLAMTFGILVWRWLYITLISSPRFYKRVLIVGDSFDIKKIISNLEGADPNYKIVGYINTDSSNEVGDMPETVQEYPIENLTFTVSRNGISEIVVASDYSDGVSKPLYLQLINLLESGFSIREYMQVYEEITQRIPVQHVDKDFYRYFPFSRSNQNKFYKLFHRLFDIIMALIGIAFFLIIFPFVLIGNLIGNRGPIFYTQKRIGRNGFAFKIIKLRTMVTDAEKDGAMWAKKNDTRITRFGKFLRRSRIDEIPQFFNILFGEMSVIGPRPERPVFVRELSEQIPFYETRHVVKPGLTGWAQVMGSYGSSTDDALEKLQFDLYYIKHRNLFMDLSIVLKTISTVVFYRGQ